MAYVEFEVTDENFDDELFFERMNDLLAAVDAFNEINYASECGVEINYLTFAINRERVIKAANAFAKVFDSSIEL